MRGQRRIDSLVGHQPQQLHQFYSPRCGTTGNHLSFPNCSFTRGQCLSEHHSPVSGFSRRLTSLSPASRPLSSENRWRMHSSDSAGHATNQVSTTPGVASLSRHRSAGAYPSSNYLRPLSMNYPAHRHLSTTTQPASSGVSHRTHLYGEPEDQRSTASSRSSSRGRKTSDLL